MRPRVLLPALLLVLAAALPAGAAASVTQQTLFEAPREMASDDAALRSRTLDEITGFGVRWMRVVVYWRSVAPNPGDWRRPAGDMSDPGFYDWSRIDREVDEMRARGISVLMTLSGPIPDWASRSRHSATQHPSADLFGRFALAAGRHFAGRVSHWAIWNEPNHPDFLGPQFSRGRAVSPGIYRELFQQGARGLRAAAPRQTILMGETAPIGTSRVVSPLTFLRKALCLDGRYRRDRRCGRLDADGYAHHAYFHGTPTSRPPHASDVTIGVLGRLNHALAAAGRAGALRRGLPIWLTEFGVQSRPDPYIGVSEATQNEYRAISERIAYRNPRVAMFSQYLMRDDQPRPGPARQRYSGFESGLRFADGRTKISYDGFPLPLVAARGARSVTLWGLARPARSATTVLVEYRGTRGGWRRLKRVRTDRRGVFTTSTRLVSGRRYRLVWDGHRSPAVRVR